jgi:D-alanyl-D-alanine carboxypeptidase (penicillin-binding protein 5/6)
MLPNRFRFFALWSMLLFWTTAAIAAPIPVPAPPQINAASYVLMDHDSGRLLVNHNADSRVEPASITKIMTAYVAFQQIADGDLKLDEQVTISEKAWRSEGSRTFLKIGSQIDVETLIKGMIVQSGNDASIALAEHIAGAEESFAGLMNQYAQKLGMTNTHFMNATGLPDPNHYTTAHDIALMAQAMIRDFPQYYTWYSIRQLLFNGIEQHNRNRLLWRDASVDGMKTGHTSSAGFCLVSSAKRDQMRLISVVMGTPSDNERQSGTAQLWLPLLQHPSPLPGWRSRHGSPRLDGQGNQGRADPAEGSLHHGASGSIRRGENPGGSAGETDRAAARRCGHRQAGGAFQ